MTEIHISNTPIFDQLVSDFRDRGINFDRLIAGGPIALRPTEVTVEPDIASSTQAFSEATASVQRFQETAVHTLFEKNEMG